MSLQTCTSVQAAPTRRSRGTPAPSTCSPHVRRRPASPRARGTRSTRRLSRTRSASASLPRRSRTPARGIVAILSTMIWLGRSIPVTALGSIAIRVSGASTCSVVKGQTVTEAVAPQRSSWTMTTGLGVPVQPPRAAAIPISPRLTRPTSPRSPSQPRCRRRMPGRRTRARWPQRPPTGVGLEPRTQGPGRRAAAGVSRHSRVHPGARRDATRPDRRRIPLPVWPQLRGLHCSRT